jgi:hypothetical protein
MSASFIPKSDFLSVLMERGYIHQCSDFEGVDAKAKAGELIAYIGFDCTASSLHVGSLVQIMMLRWLQKTGGKPVPLMGGGTTRVGDPSGKDESRRMLSLDDIEANKTSIKQVFSKFLTFGEARTDAVMPDNAEWLTALNYIDFLRDVGRHFSVNRMLSMDSVKMRLERDQELLELNFRLKNAIAEKREVDALRTCVIELQTVLKPVAAQHARNQTRTMRDLHDHRLCIGQAKYKVVWAQPQIHHELFGILGVGQVVVQLKPARRCALEVLYQASCSLCV